MTVNIPEVKLNIMQVMFLSFEVYPELIVELHKTGSSLFESLCGKYFIRSEV